MMDSFRPPVDRRQFLRLTALGSAGLALTGCRTAETAPQDRELELHLALLSDTHISADPQNAYRGFRPWLNLQQAVADILAARPAGAVLCGDAARLEGKREDYLELKGLLDPLVQTMPVYVGLGNHDDRANFAAVFTAPPGIRPKVADRHITVVEHPAVRLILLDPLLYTNKVAGFLGRSQRMWLAEYLTHAADRPVVLVVHHTLGDDDGCLLDVDRLFALIRPHPQVQAILYGHSHAWGLSERQKLKLINLPSVGYNFQDQQPVGWVEARFRTSGVVLVLHALAGNRMEDGRRVDIAWH